MPTRKSYGGVASDPLTGRGSDVQESRGRSAAGARRRRRVAGAAARETNVPAPTRASR